MRFWINNYVQAREFIPNEPTLAIRIFDPEYKDAAYWTKDGNHPGNKLFSSHWWVAELTYTFADLDPTIYEFDSPPTFDRLVRDPNCFTQTTAQRILRDFAANYENSSAVMVHCNAGLSRSPAIALALAHRFNIKPEWKGRRHKLMAGFENDLRRVGRAANYWVYSMLMETEF